jgi:biotin-(acetyl-CoA carboxylase) ligase
MRILSDGHDYAAQVLPSDAVEGLSSSPSDDPTADWLARTFLGEGPVLHGRHLTGGPWQYLIISRHARRSQYDLMIQLARGPRGLPDRLVSVAGSGEGFHGYKGRPWSAAPGNVHATIHLTPNRVIERFDTAFTVLAALSVVEAVDAVPGLSGRAGIKWVNDVLVDGAKVAGILSYTQTRNDTVTGAVLGIGLNVETAPRVERTLFVPSVGALRDFAGRGSPPTQRDVLHHLLDAVDENYRTLLERGYGILLNRYRERSCIVGSQVVVCEEGPEDDPRVLLRGRVAALGEGLELYLDGREEPVSTGRLILTDQGGRHPPPETPAAPSGRARSPRRDAAGRLGTSVESEPSGRRSW